MIHWSDENRFLLHVTHWRMRVWRQNKMVYTQRSIQHYEKRNRWCRSDNMVRLITDFDFSATDFKRFLSALADSLLFGNPCFFLEQGYLRMASVWPSDAVPCLHTATLHVVFRILASLSGCWFRCVFLQACWLLYRDNTSDVKYIWRTFMFSRRNICHLCHSVFAYLIWGPCEWSIGQTRTGFCFM
jgi:hypothetical protein